jgi:hypothetical protein
MRKFLLAATAMIGVTGVVPLANAQVAPPPTTGIAAKTQPYYMGEYARLYPAFDGETPNGVKYGASMEIRQNSGGTGVNNAPANKVALLAIPCTGAVRRVM